MTITLHYSHGSPIRDGDKVVIGGGRPGIVLEVFDNDDDGKTVGVHGRGIVVDAEPGGLVFLSAECLVDEPPEFLGRGPSGWVRFFARMALSLGMVLLVPALVSLASAIYSAASTGEVLVVFIGYNDGQIESVHWQIGWARFAGPLLLLGATALCVPSPRWSLRWYLACVASGLGVLMLVESLLFTSLTGSLIAVSVLFGLPLVEARFRKERAPI